MLNASLVRGGSHRLNSGIMRSGYEAGLEVKELTEAKKIIIEDGEAKGVLTSKGEEIRGKAVVSTLNPPKTFLDLVERTTRSCTFQARSKNGSGMSGASFAFILAQRNSRATKPKRVSLIAARRCHVLSVTAPWMR